MNVTHQEHVIAKVNKIYTNTLSIVYISQQLRSFNTNVQTWHTDSTMQDECMNAYRLNLRPIRHTGHPILRGSQTTLRIKYAYVAHRPPLRKQ